jgi:hypothetical protein
MDPGLGNEVQHDGGMLVRGKFGCRGLHALPSVVPSSGDSRVCLTNLSSDNLLREVRELFVLPVHRCVI